MKKTLTTIAALAILAGGLAAGSGANAASSDTPAADRTSVKDGGTALRVRP